MKIVRSDLDVGVFIGARDDAHQVRGLDKLAMLLIVAVYVSSIYCQPKLMHTEVHTYIHDLYKRGELLSNKNFSNKELPRIVSNISTSLLSRRRLLHIHAYIHTCIK